MRASREKSQMEPNIGLKRKRKRKFKGNTYLGKDVTKTLPVHIPPEVKKAKKEAEMRAMDLINENIEDAIKVFVDGLKDKDKWYRYNCACALVKKIIPDKRSYTKKLEMPNNGKIINNYIDRRGEVVNILNVLDELGFEDLRERASNGSVGLLESSTGGKAPEEEAVFEGEEEVTRRSRSKKRSRTKEGLESFISVEIE